MYIFWKLLGEEIMAIINTIKERILELNQGLFQNLCDQILLSMGYDNLVSLGSQAGTQKTTKGTPDTYCIVDGNKYVLVEYTTQDRQLFSKIKDDINKCLEANIIGIEISKIAEIIYFHTSSNLSPKQDDEIKNLCMKKGVDLSIWGIDRIAHNLYSQNRFLAKDYLGIKIDTNQIFTVEEFIKNNDALCLAAPLDNEFMYRTEELHEIDNILKTQDVVVLVGQAGTGKTRLAVEYAKKRIENSGDTVYCIRDNALSLYEDLKLYIDSPGNYLLIVDDANQIAELSHIFFYLAQKGDGINVKIIITVRDYALNDVRRKIIEYTTFNHILVNVFSNDKIVEIIKSSLGITNQQCLDRIAEVSNGNARIAMIAGRTVLEEGNLLSLADVSTLYESYYGNSLGNLGLSSDRNLLVAFGITAFINSFHIDLLDYLIPVFEASKISKDDFLECIYQLYSLELVDICNDKAVKVSEQCLSNYILKLVFYDKKMVSLSLMVKAFFPINQTTTISSVNVLTNVFYSKPIIAFVETELRTIWNDLSKLDNNSFFEFVKAFYPINEIATLQILKQKIESVDAIDFDEKFANTTHYTNDDIITILGGFYRCENHSMAIELFLLYYRKRPDLYQQFFNAIKQYYVINKYSQYNGFLIEKELITAIRKFSKEWTDRAFVYLFMDIAKFMLNFRFELYEPNHGHSFTFSYVTLHSDENIFEWRNQVWNYLLETKNSHGFNNCIQDIFRDYGHFADSNSLEIIIGDCAGIYKIISGCLEKDNLVNCIIVDKYISFLRNNNLNEYINHEIVDSFLLSEQLDIYKTLVGNPAYEYNHYGEEIIDRKQKIRAFIKDADILKIQTIIDTCNTYFFDKENKVKKGLEILFEVLYESNNNYLEAIQYYLLSNTPKNISPEAIIQNMFQLLDEKELLDLICLPNYSQKNEWIYFYYYLFPTVKINESVLNDFYDFLLDDSDKCILSSVYREIGFIKKFNSVDERALIKSCRIIFNKKSYSPFIVNIYFNLLFHDQIISIDDVLELFALDIELLQNIYLFETIYEEHFDYNGCYFLVLSKIDSGFALRFFSSIISDSVRLSILDYSEQIEKLYEFDNYIELFEIIAKTIVESLDYYYHYLQEYFDIAVKYSDTEKTNHLIMFFIENYYANDNYMDCLFEAITKMSDAKRIAYIIAFINKNKSLDAFKKIPVISDTYSGAGSEVPILNREKEFIIKLNQKMHGIEYIDHKQYLVEKEKIIEDNIQKVQIREYLRGN